MAWYVIRTRPSLVFDVKQRMEQCGAECYCPCIWRVVRPRRARNAREIPKPAFPGYIFLKERDIDQLAKMPHRRYQILRMSADEYISLSDEHIEKIKEMERQWIEQSRPPKKPTDHFAVGDVVRLHGDNSGLFGHMVVKGFIGRHVKVDLFNEETKIDARSLEKVK